DLDSWVGRYGHIQRRTEPNIYDLSQVRKGSRNALDRRRYSEREHGITAGVLPGLPFQYTPGRFDRCAVVAARTTRDLRIERGDACDPHSAIAVVAHGGGIIVLTGTSDPSRAEPGITVSLRKRSMKSRRVLVVLGILVACAAPLRAQQTSWDPTGRQLTRAELEQMLAEFERTAASGEYSGTLRERARTEAALIRLRLQEGDLRVGDQIQLQVENHTALTNTFTVVAGRMIILPELGQVPLE